MTRRSWLVVAPWSTASRASLRLTALALLLWSAAAHADGGGPLGGWTLDPLVVPVLAVTGALYARGAWVLLTRKDLVHGLNPWQAGAFAAGWLTAALALLSPLERLADVSLPAHVGQHELLMLVAAPLVVLGRPLVPFLWAFPLELRRALVAKTRARAVVRSWRFLTHPLFIVIVHGATIWLWHVPVLFEAALRSEAVHAAQHAMFFFTAVLFFQAIVYGRSNRMGYGPALAYVFVTAAHTSLLGALLTFAGRAWYPLYAERGAADPLRDQQLAGLLMGVPTGLLLTGVGLALVAAWLAAAERGAKPSKVERLTPRGGPATRTQP